MVKTVIFDFDGVIADTFELNYKICRQFFPQLNKQDFRDYHNGNVFKSKIIKWNDELLAQFYQKQQQLISPKNIFPIKNELVKLSQKYSLLIISSTADKTVQKYLKLSNLDQYFDQIYGATTEKSKVKKFEKMLAQHELKPNECLFVTDTIGDIKEARKAGIKSIAVTWGYHPLNLLKKESPVAIVKNIDNLANTIKTFSKKMIKLNI